MFAIDQRTVDAVLEFLTAPLYRFLDETENEDDNRRPPAETSAVIKVAFAADTEVEVMCWRVLPLLLRGHVLVVVLLYQDERRLSVRLPALMSLMAASLPPGVLNLVTGLGLEAGIALVDSSEAVSPSLLIPPRCYTSYPSPVCCYSAISP